jgi:hypothetical protein
LAGKITRIMSSPGLIGFVTGAGVIRVLAGKAVEAGPPAGSRAGPPADPPLG